MAPLAPIPANRHGNTGNLGHSAIAAKTAYWNGERGSGYPPGYGGSGVITPTTTGPHAANPYAAGPSPLRQGTVARHEVWLDQQQYASSYPPPTSEAYNGAYTPARYLGPPSAPFAGTAGALGASGAFGAPSAPNAPLAPDERAQLLVLREFYDIVTGPEKDGERARRLRGIAAAAGLPLHTHPLTTSQPHLDSDALLHRWLRWVRYCRQEAGDVQPFFHLMRSTLYGDAFWAAREEGERLCARALSALYERDGSPGQRPDPRARSWSYSDRTVLQTAATLASVRWAVASLEYQQETNRALERTAAPGALRPALVALLIAPTMPRGPERAVPTRSGPRATPLPLEGPCIVIRTTDAQYAAQVNWDFACMLGYLTLLRPFFVGTGHPGDYRELPSPRADTSITPHLHQFALALTSEPGCPVDLGCECARVAWALNLPPPLHPRATDELDGRAVEDHAAQGGGGFRERTPASTPFSGVPFSGVPFADWPPDDERLCAAVPDGDEAEGVGMPASAPPHTPHTVIEVWRAQAEAQAAARATATQPADNGPADQMAATWTGNAADLVDTDLKVALLDTGMTATTGPDGAAATVATAATSASSGATAPLLSAEDQRYVTPVLPVLRPHRGGGGSGKGKKPA